MGYGNGDYGGSVMTTGASAMPIAPPRLPAVQSQVEQLDKRACSLQQIVNELESRLSAVTMPDGPSTPVGVNKPVEGSPVALASTLVDINQRLDGVFYRLQSLLNRIEL